VSGISVGHDDVSGQNLTVGELNAANTIVFNKNR
jgi:hypothetical protein